MKRPFSGIVRVLFGLLVVLCLDIAAAGPYWIDSAAKTVPSAEKADLILTGGKIVTVDKDFSTASAMAIAGERILAVGTDEEIAKLAGPDTRRIDLAGKTVIPGLIDSHLHAPAAAIYEFDHRVPTMECIADVLKYVADRAEVLDDGEWIVIQQVFITRLRERRYPTRDELDKAAPKNPVFFRTGPDCSVNSLALKEFGVDENYRLPADSPGKIERDPKTGRLTGILRGCRSLFNPKGAAKEPTDGDKYNCLKELLADYNRVGLTSITDRWVTPESMALYEKLLANRELSARVFLTHYVDVMGPMETIEKQIVEAANHPLRKYNNRLWLRGIKGMLDGGMLTGSAYLKEPWGESEIYGIKDPSYRGFMRAKPEKVYQVAKTALENHMQFTAHVVGDGAVEALVEAYRKINDEDFPVAKERPCLCHSNFMSPWAIETMKRCGIVADLQPDWLHMDGSTLLKHFGEKRLEWFQPYKTLYENRIAVGGGSDHMQKIGRRRSINSYDPFLGIWIAMTRQPRWIDMPLHPEQRLSREQAIRLYTINNAYITFQEHEKGSLEPGKLADFVIIGKDILACPVDEIKDIEVEATYLGGEPVYVKGG